jgi:hypothetical protein
MVYEDQRNFHSSQAGFQGSPLARQIMLQISHDVRDASGPKVPFTITINDPFSPVTVLAGSVIELIDVSAHSCLELTSEKTDVNSATFRGTLFFCRCIHIRRISKVNRDIDPLIIQTITSPEHSSSR